MRRLDPSFYVGSAVLLVWMLACSNTAPSAPPSAPAASVVVPAPVPSDLVSFKVAALYRTAGILLVAADTTEWDLMKLVHAFRTARQAGTLSQFIPPTTPTGKTGPFAVVMLFVMSDPQWATVPRLTSFVNPTSSAVTLAEREFGKRILASYYFTAVMNPNHEEGTIGYEGEGRQYTAKYKKLF